MFVDPGGNGKDIGVEDNIFRRKADPGEQLVGAFANLDLAILCIRLSGFVKGHDHDGGSISHAFARMAQEFFLAFLHRDAVDDRLAGDAFQACLDHRPFAAVDHHRHPRDIGLGGNQLEKGGHRVMRVEQAFVHVDIDHLRAILDLLAGDLDRGFIIVVEDQFLEAGRAGNIGALRRY